MLLVWLLATGPALGQTPALSPSPDPEMGQVWVESSGLRLLRISDLNEISASDRADLLLSRIERVLADPRLPIHVEPVVLNGNTVLVCQGVQLVSVTAVDAEAHNLDVPTLAARWQSALEDGLTRLARERSGEFLKGALVATGVALLAGIFLHVLVGAAARRWFATPGLSLRALSWAVIFTIILWQFPTTRELANGLVTYAVWPAGLLMAVLLGALLGGWVLDRAIIHYFAALERDQAKSPQAAPRWRQRLHTGRQVSMFVSRAVLTVLGLGTYLSLLKVNLGAVLAGAGVIGVGLGLAAQDVLRDWMAGINIVLEDQFGAGDIIQAGEFEGTVENFTLRITQLRDTQGSLITLPNSTIRMVRNLSNVWSQVDTTIPVAYDTDLRQAMQVIQATAHELRQEMPDVVLDEPNILGLDEFAPYAIRLRLLLRTAPQQQFPVRRELLLRLWEAFRREGIEIPSQQMRVITVPEPGSTPSPADT